MIDNKKLSTFELINKGYLWVNIPSIIIILIVWYCLLAYLELNGKISAIIGGVLGWVYWEFSIKKWIRWALDHNVQSERLLKIGQLALLLWSQRTLDKVINKNK